MLEQKRQNETGNQEKLPVYKEAEEQAAEGQRGCIGFQDAFHVPFLVEPFQAA
jgi:hypothetical protein